MIAYPFRALQCCLTDGGGLPTHLLSQPEIGYPSDHLVSFGRAVYLFLVGDNDENPPCQAPLTNCSKKAREAALGTCRGFVSGRLLLCPIILGHAQGREKALTYQFAGQSKKGLPPGGQWRCLWLSEVSNVRLRDGPWHAGDSHNQPQGCVDVVDLDVNPASPYNPKRRL
jgi:hypothetical protein